MNSLRKVWGFAALALMTMFGPTHAWSTEISTHNNHTSFLASQGLLNWYAGPSAQQYGMIYFDVVAHLDSDGNVLDGRMIAYGSGTDGRSWTANDPTLLFIGNIVSISLNPTDAFACPAPLPCTWTGNVQHVLDMETVYINPIIPDWGNRARATSNTWVEWPDQFMGPEFTAENLFRYNWTSFSTHSLSIVGYVPEPGTIGLMGLGLLGLMVSRRRAGWTRPIHRS